MEGSREEDYASEPDEEMVRAVVNLLDEDQDGKLSPKEVKRLFGAVPGVVEAGLPDDHDEMLAYCNMTMDELVEKLCDKASKEQIDFFYSTLTGNRDQEDEAAASNSPVQPQKRPGGPLAAAGGSRAEKSG